MRLRKIPGMEDRVAAEFPHLVIFDPEQWRGRWQQRFEQTGPISLEIGMGRGRFINALSQAEPKQNFVAVEMHNEVIYDAGLKIGDDRKNVAVISARAEGLPQWFAPGEVERIYLNFSDPWPKRAHCKRRLTHENFLALYREILPPEGEILLRTDAASLMEFSLVEMTNHGFSLAEVSFDLHNSPYFDGFTTEYEEKKSKTGPIYYGRFVLKK